MSAAEVHFYPLTGPTSAATLDHALRTLRPHLPVCIPLYRRLQFGRFFAATSLVTNIAPGTTPPQDTPWLIAFADRSCRPETEVWFFGSWEIQPSIPDDQHSAIDTLLRNTITAMKALDIPPSPHQAVPVPDNQQTARANPEHDDERDKVGLSRRDYGGHMADPQIMLWGAVHERTVPVLQRLGLLTLRFKARLVPNHTFLWDVDSLPRPKELPAGLGWREMQRNDFALVRSRTQIPRQDRTLAVLPSLALYPSASKEDADPAPVSWAFVGLDASLTTLHVEPAYRGQGLAKMLTTKLFKEKMDGFWEQDVPRWAHGYVIVGNTESEGMCRSLGGTSGWETFWLRVDLGAM